VSLEIKGRFKVKAPAYASFLAAASTAAVVTGGLLFLTLGPVAGQDAAKGGGKGAGKGGAKAGGYQPPEGPTPKLANGKPDFSGFWQRPYSPDMSAGATDLNGKAYPAEDPQHRTVALDPANAPAAGRGGGGRGRVLPYTAFGAQDWKTYDPSNGDYTGACLPFGLMRSINSPDPLQIMQSQTFFAELFEQNTWFHVFPIDGRAHTKGTPTWFGDSVGKWDGDTLVVETNNFNGRTRLDTNGHGHSDQLVFTERWTRTDLGHIEYEMRIHDPKYYTEDWKNNRQFLLRTDQQIMEYSCEENNKSLYEGRIKAPKFDQP
jgi:hypothetical protein